MAQLAATVNGRPMTVEVEADALEELPGFGVGVLIRVQDVGAVAVQDLGEGGHQAAPVGAGDQQRRDSSGGHGCVGRHGGGV